MYFNIISICILIFIIYKNKKEKFSSEEIKSKSLDIYKNKDVFVPGANYTNVKQTIKWIDPIVYNDVYKLALNEKISISNLEKTLYNSIQ
jgi:hypothetical protein